MTMYLPNTDIRPTGYEPAEFIEPEEFAPADPRPAKNDLADEDEESLAP